MARYIEERMAQIRADPSLTMTPRPRKTAPPLPSEQAYIYFVRMGTHVKIGITRDVAARMKAIQTSSPEKVMLLKIERGTVEDEQRFHHRFRRYRANGEWFALQGWLATFLKDCIEPVAVPSPIMRPNFFDAMYPSPFASADTMLGEAKMSDAGKRLIKAAKEMRRPGPNWRPAVFTYEANEVCGNLYYFAPAERAPGPSRKQIHVRAIIDIAADGTLAGVELIDDMPPLPAPSREDIDHGE